MAGPGATALCFHKKEILLQWWGGHNLPPTLSRRGSLYNLLKKC